MKTFVHVVLALSGLFLLIIALPQVVAYVGRSRVPEMTPPQVKALFQAAGGIDEVDREAEMIFKHRGPNDFPVLQPRELANARAIQSLYTNLEMYSGTKWNGASAAIWPGNNRCIDIRFGNHWLAKHILIYDPAIKKVSLPDWSTNWFYLSSNILVSR